MATVLGPLMHESGKLYVKNYVLTPVLHKLIPENCAKKYLVLTRLLFSHRTLLGWYNLHAPLPYTTELLLTHLCSACACAVQVQEDPRTVKCAEASAIQ